MTEISYRPLGRSGLMVSTIGMGGNNFGRTGTATETQEGTTAMVDAAIELGVTLIDTADIYGGRGLSESLLGVALAGRRDDVVIATKWGHPQFDMGIAPGSAKGSRTYIRAAIEGSLTRLNTDHVELYQMHGPDPVTPIEETIGALQELVTEGKIQHFGHSNFSARQIDAADDAAAALGGPRFESAQDEYSLLARGVERDVLPAVRSHGLGFLPYFPLYNGLLTGKFTRNEHPGDSRLTRQKPELLEDVPWDTLERYQTLCEARGITMLEATFGWLLAQPNLTSVIAGATRPQQLAQNAAAASVDLSAEDVAAISEIFV
ncbi:aldo/keto reductase [soil metagenome]